MEKNLGPETSATVRFDGEAFRPLTPVPLIPDGIYEITIRARREPETRGTLWELLGELAGTVEGPIDWAAEHDHYIHGTPRREHGSNA